MAIEESQRAVELSNVLQNMEASKSILSGISEIKSVLQEHIKAEEAERRESIKAMSSLTHKTETISESFEHKLDLCHAKVRTELNREMHENIRSLKTELTRDIEHVADMIDKSTTLRNAELKLMYARLEVVETRQAGFAEHIDMFKKLVLTVLGTIAVGLISYFNVKK